MARHNTIKRNEPNRNSAFRSHADVPGIHFEIVLRDGWNDAFAMGRAGRRPAVLGGSPNNSSHRFLPAWTG
jgi:hypothetical protein